uniref:Plexin domain containing 1 n=1 Tax=Scophthalmus maximus TaxID=52904 RepID=A0A8D3D615_SCOMX
MLNMLKGLLTYGSFLTGYRSSATSHQRHPRRVQRSPSGHAVMSRAVLGGGLTIDTLPDNMTRVVEDSGKYYTWRSFGPEDQRTRELWVDMSDVRHGQVRVHGILSNSYKQAVRVALSFDFPFYGHHLRQITIATGGFIFTGDITHRMLTTTQYIAPLMANFDPSYSKESTVQYLDNGEVFVVQWEGVRLPGRESAGAFTFQAALYKTGTITFSYRDIPLSLDVIGSAEHPVKVGLSDAFMVTSPDISDTEAQRRTIYEYHRVTMDKTKITNYSAVEFTALPTCLQHDSCERCLSSNQTSGCSWCHVLQRCSDGMDRHRQEWLDYACSEECVSIFDTDVKTDSSTQGEGFANTGAIAGIAAALVLLLALILVPLYITWHPTVASPLYLIQRKNYWPSLKFHKKQPGYTEVEGDGHDKDSIVEAGPH